MFTVSPNAGRNWSRLSHKAGYLEFHAACCDNNMVVQWATEGRVNTAGRCHSQRSFASLVERKIHGTISNKNFTRASLSSLNYCVWE